MNKGSTIVGRAIAMSGLCAAFLLVGSFVGAAAAATPPQITGATANVTGSSTVTVSAFVNPEGQTTTYEAVYDLSSSTWCTSGGASGSPTHSTTAVTLGFADSTFHQVHVAVSGLTAGTSYCTAISAHNATGTSIGLPAATFTSGAPGTKTTSTTVTGASTARVVGQVDPTGQTTTYGAAYDLSSSTWCTSGGASGTPANTTPTTALGFTDNSFHSVTVSLGGLTGGTHYCVAIVAHNAFGNATPSPIGFTAGAPSAFTFAASATGTSTASLAGEVNPAGQSTTYGGVYDLASSTWCTSHGRSGSPAHSTPTVTLGFTDANYHSVTVALSGLTAGAQYCAAIAAGNASASANAFPVPFTAGSPSASTFTAQATGAATASLQGSVNPAGQTTTYGAVYDLASSTWCASGGNSGSPANATPTTTLPFTDSTDHSVTVALSGLTAGTKYCAATIAHNASATATGSPTSFTAGAPAVQTRAVTVVSATAATLSGLVNPTGQTTTYGAVYDLASSLWCSSHGRSGSPAHATPTATLGFSDNTYHSVSVALSGLTGGTHYCAAVIAHNASVSATGIPTSFIAGTPAANTTSVMPSGSTSESVGGSVDPSGQTTTYGAAYDLASSTWCQSNGRTGSPAHSTATATLPFTDSNFHPVTVAVSGLTTGASYCVAIVASNGSGPVTAVPIPFKAGAPAVATTSITPNTTTTATVNGRVNPAGQTTTYQAVYALGSTQWCSTHGRSGTPTQATTPVTLAFTDGSFHVVSVGLSGLTASTPYCAAIRATNAASTATGNPITFTS